MELGSKATNGNIGLHMHALILKNGKKASFP